MGTVDVVIVSYNSKSSLRAAVEPFAEFREGNVIVVDNASTDGSLGALADLSTKRLELEENHGFAFGCNRGAAEGAAPAVLFLNPDADINVANVKQMLRTLDEDPRVGVVGPRIVNHEGRTEFSIRRDPRVVSTFAQAFFLHRMFDRSQWADEVVRVPELYDRNSDVEWLSGACLLARRSVLEELGGWDEGFFLYCEDADLCKRVRAAGHLVRFDATAVAKHKGGASAPRASTVRHLAASRGLYADKHFSRAGALTARLGIALGAFLHAVFGKGGMRLRIAYVFSIRDALRPTA